MRSPLPTLLPSELDAIQMALRERGVCVIKGAYSVEQMARFQAEYHKRLAVVKRKLPTLTDWETRRYEHYGPTARFDKNLYDGVASAHLDDGSGVIWMDEGRFDFSYGMDEGIFDSDEFQRPPGVGELIDRTLRHDYESYAGGLPCEKGCIPPGRWHRDVYSLFDDHAYDVALPCWYFTMLVPLVPLNEENGATEFWIGSHKQKLDDFPDERDEVGFVCASPGDVVLFDGRILHRGGEKRTEEPRHVMYVVFKKCWYADEAAPQIRRKVRSPVGRANSIDRSLRRLGLITAAVLASLASTVGLPLSTPD